MERKLSFEEKVQTEYYDKALVTTSYESDRKQWGTERANATVRFLHDMTEFAVERGVPRQYVRNVIDEAWANGHAHGYGEVLNCLYPLIDIFEVHTWAPRPAAIKKAKGKA